MDQQVSQLGPGKDHHGQISAGQCQPAAQFSGGNALRRGGCPDGKNGQAPQKQHPVQQGGQGKSHDGHQLRVSLTDVGADRGEHLLRHLHGHGDALPVIELDQAGADDLAAPDLHVQIGHNTDLSVNTGEGGGIRHILRGHGNGEAEKLHRIIKAAQQGDGQLQKGCKFGLRIGTGLFGNSDFYRLGDGVADVHGDITGVIPGNFAQIHQRGRRRGAGGGAVAVEGNTAGIGGYGKGHLIVSRFQPQPQVHGNPAVTVRGNAALHVHLGGSGFRRCRDAQNTCKGNTKGQRQKQAPQEDPSFSISILFI